MRLPNAFPHKRYRLGLPLSYYTNASLFSFAHLHCLRVHHQLCVFSTTARAKLVYQDLHIPVLPLFVGFHNIGRHFRYFVESRKHEPSKHVCSAHCQQRIVLSAHVLVKFLNLQVTGSFDDRKVHYFFYVCVRNKFALAMLGFQSFSGYLVASFNRLQVCYLCSYVRVDHFHVINMF